MRVRVLSLALAAGALLLAAPLQLAQARPMWGVLGHYMTAAIAQGFLTPAARNGVANLLPEVDGDMGLVASWADQVGRDMFPWSPPLHFINTPDWACTYERKRDCIDSGRPNYCVDGAIQNFTSQLVANRAPLSMKVALMFTIHFIGDIHQPLHVGFTSDEGGNTIKGTFEGTYGRKLHQVWDEDMIEKRINDDYQGDNSTYLQYFMDRMQSGDWASQVSGWQACPEDDPSDIHACSQSWASQSVTYACSTAYVDQTGAKIEDDFDLENPYYEFAYPVAELQIARGGVRLANVVNAIFAKSELAEYTVEPQVYKRMQAQKERRRQRMMRGGATDEDIALA